MAFDSLSQRLNGALRSIQGKSKLTEKNMEDMLKEIRLALLEADVNYRVVKDFLSRVQEKSIGAKVLESVNPSQMIVKIVHDEIIALLGDNQIGINYKQQGTTIVMMVGLQGTGKTTSIAKIANLITKKDERKVLLVAADVIRPAAIEQLQTLGKEIGVEVFSQGVETSAVNTVKEALDYAKTKDFDTILIDTAGRLHIDEELMNELQQIKDLTHPDDILLTVDAMTGQDIVTVAQSFHTQLDVTGLVVTKFDGDSRGGGVLSVKALTQVPVKFVGQGEKIEDLDKFYPERMADRILGMGDIVTLVEQAQEKMDIEASEASAKRLMSGEFTLDDMLLQFEQVSKMGPLGNILKMLPGGNELSSQINDEQASSMMKKNKAIIQSMTKAERQDPSRIRSTMKKRIASGSGTSVTDVNKLINQFMKMKQTMPALMRLGQDPTMMQKMQARMKSMGHGMPFNRKGRF